MGVKFPLTDLTKLALAEASSWATFEDHVASMTLIHLGGPKPADNCSKVKIGKRNDAVIQKIVSTSHPLALLPVSG